MNRARRSRTAEVGEVLWMGSAAPGSHRPQTASPEEVGIFTHSQSEEIERQAGHPAA